MMLSLLLALVLLMYFVFIDVCCLCDVAALSLLIVRVVRVPVWRCLVDAVGIVDVSS